MMGRTKKALFRASSLLPRTVIEALTGNEGLLPYHHVVSDKSIPHIKHLYSFKSISQFRLDLKYLLRHYRPINIEELIYAVRRGEGLPKKTFLLTFDDGFREIYDVIAPILLEHKVPSIFFVNPAYIGNQALFYRCKISLIIEKIYLNCKEGKHFSEIASILNLDTNASIESIVHTLVKVTHINQTILDDISRSLEISFSVYLKNDSPYMSSNQIGELAKEGFNIGAHSWNHPYYNLLKVEEMLKETIDSSDFVYNTYGQKNRLFSFPHIDKEISQEFFDLLKEDGRIDLIFGTQNQRDEIMNNVLHRFNSERPNLLLSHQANGIHLYLKFIELIGMKKIIRTP